MTDCTVNNPLTMVSAKNYNLMGVRTMFNDIYELIVQKS